MFIRRGLIDSFSHLPLISNRLLLDGSQHCQHESVPSELIEKRKQMKNESSHSHNYNNTTVVNTSMCGLSYIDIVSRSQVPFQLLDYIQSRI